MRLLVKLLCCLIPLKRWRKDIKHNLISIREQRKKLESFGCVIEDSVLTTPTGIRFDVSKNLDNSLFLVIEVFFSSEYNLNIAKESIVIDIGMNRAAAALLFASNEKIEKIYAYEPFKPTFELAQKNIRLNPLLSQKIVPRNFGLGKAETTLELPYSASASVGMSTTHIDHKNRKDTQTETVHVKDASKELESILQENKGKYIIVKCDCEGAEFEIFERLQEMNIVSEIDVIMMEYHFDSPHKLINILIENGFAVQLNSYYSEKHNIGFLYAVKLSRKNQ